MNILPPSEQAAEDIFREWLSAAEKFFCQAAFLLLFIMN